MKYDCIITIAWTHFFFLPKIHMDVKKCDQKCTYVSVCSLVVFLRENKALIYKIL